MKVNQIMSIIAGRIDLTKIDKARIFKGKNGAEYLDICLMENHSTDAYGNDFMVVQQVDKEEREAGTRGAILGNGKYLAGKPNGGLKHYSPEKEKAGKTTPAAKPTDDDDKFGSVPF